MDSVYIGGMMYSATTLPGLISFYETSMPIAKTMWKIRKDWRTLTREQLLEEAAIKYNISESQVTKKMMDDIINQYEMDWKSWPVKYGAPYIDLNKNGVFDPVLDENGLPVAGKGDYPGITDADQVIFLLVNDQNIQKSKEVFGVKPIGLDLNITIWTYKEEDYGFLANTIFKRYRIRNRSKYIIDSLYFSIFSDPDVGNYSNDLMGCDSTADLCFAFNGDQSDNEFDDQNIIPPVVGYAILQGPIIETDNMQDKAVYDFQYIYGFKNLPMTSFSNLSSEYGSNEDPIFRGYEFGLIVYNLMRGFMRFPYRQEPWIKGSGPDQGKPTKFPLSGDPVKDPFGLKGDVDGAGWNMWPGDRRLMANTGPCRLEPGAEQELLIAVIGGNGKNNRDGINEVKHVNQVLKELHQNLFENLQFKPQSPEVKALPLDDKILLDWSWDRQKISKIEQSVFNGYKFEGYNVYQLPDSNTALDDARVVRLATIDVIDNVKDILAPVYFPQYDRKIIIPVQRGNDTGIRRYFIVNRDSIGKKALYRGSTYYFAVTAYDYNPLMYEFPSFESEPSIAKVTLQEKKPGEKYFSRNFEKIPVKANKTDYEDNCDVVVINPKATTGHDYEIFFTLDQDSTSPTYGQLTWNLRDLNINKIILANQPQLKDTLDYSKSIVDGLLIKVYGQTPNIKAVVQVADAEGPLTPDEYDEQGARYNGNNVWHDFSSVNDLHPFYISAGGSQGELERLTRYIANTEGHDIEIRFTEDGGIFLWWYNRDVYAQIPFEAWDVGLNTYDDPSDDVRLLTGGYSSEGTVGIFDFDYTDPFLGYPATDWIYLRKPKNE
ncbi:MAG: hypothetical protein GXO75_16100, partial [Calditrichaeota bacterium]|nr:hypothetical protein [Calditrichota bacterium]